MFKSFEADTSKTAVSQCAETNRQRDVLTKQVKAGQQTVVATEPRRRDGGNRDVITGLSFSSLLVVTRAIHEHLARSLLVRRYRLACISSQSREEALSKCGSGLSPSQQIRLAAQLDQELFHSGFAGLRSASPLPQQPPSQTGNSIPLRTVQQSTKHDP